MYGNHSGAREERKEELSAKRIGQMKIVLIGYMGAGKTTLGKALAQHMGVQFYDLDWWIGKSCFMGVLPSADPQRVPPPC